MTVPAGGGNEQSYIDTYESIVRHKAQQSTNKLMGIPQLVRSGSESHNWEVMEAYDNKKIQTKAGYWGNDFFSGRAATGGSGTEVPADITPIGFGNPTGFGRQADTPDQQPLRQKRRTFLHTYHDGTTYEEEDEVQALTSPGSAQSMAMGMSFQRKIDSLIIEGVFKPAPLKANDPATTAYADTGTGAEAIAKLPPYSIFPQDQIIGGGTGDAGQISFDQITEVAEAFMLNDIDPMTPKWMVMGPQQIRRLLQTTEVTSADYASLKVLEATGYVTNFMGFNIIWSNLLNGYDGTTVGGTNEVMGFACTGAALGLHVGQDVTVRTGVDVTKSFVNRIYLRMMMDCVRVEDKQVVGIRWQNPTPS